MALAILLGLLVPPCVVTAVIDARLERAPQELVRKALVSTFLSTFLLMAAPGIAAWWIVQRRRPGPWIAAGVGAAVGATTLGAYFVRGALRTMKDAQRAVEQMPPSSPLREEVLAYTQQDMIGLVLGMTALGAVLGGLTALAMYLVAFPRSLRAVQPRDHF